MLNERYACGVQKTPPIGLNHMIPGGVVRPGSKGRFSGLARKRVNLFVGSCFKVPLDLNKSLLRKLSSWMIEVHIVCAVSFIDIFRVDGLCLEG